MERPIISVLIVDDEPLARKRMERLLRAIDRISIKGSVGTGREAVLKLNSLQYDIVFLDIQLKDMTGFHVLESLQRMPPLVIFITAFDFYAIKAFEVCAFDYLLKPYTEKRFYKSLHNAITTLEKGENKELQKTITKLLDSVGLNQTDLKTTFKNRIPVPNRKKTLFVNTDEITYIKASNYYIEIYTTVSKHILRDSMHNILKGLDPQSFERIHRSSIINLAYIVELIYSDFGELDVKMSDGKLIRVSKGYRQEFLKKIGVKG